MACASSATSALPCTPSSCPRSRHCHAGSMKRTDSVGSIAGSGTMFADGQWIEQGEAWPKRPVLELGKLVGGAAQALGLSPAATAPRPRLGAGAQPRRPASPARSAAVQVSALLAEAWPARRIGRRHVGLARAGPAAEPPVRYHRLSRCRQQRRGAARGLAVADEQLRGSGEQPEAAPELPGGGVARVEDAIGLRVRRQPVGRPPGRRGQRLRDLPGVSGPRIAANVASPLGRPSRQGRTRPRCAPRAWLAGSRSPARGRSAPATPPARR